MRMLSLICIHNIQKYLKYGIFKIVPNLVMYIKTQQQNQQLL